MRELSSINKIYWLFLSCDRRRRRSRSRARRTRRATRTKHDLRSFKRGSAITTIFSTRSKRAITFSSPKWTNGRRSYARSGTATPLSRSSSILASPNSVNRRIKELIKAAKCRIGFLKTKRICNIHRRCVICWMFPFSHRKQKKNQSINNKHNIREGYYLYIIKELLSSLVA